MLCTLKPIRVIGLFILVGVVACAIPVKPQVANLRPGMNTAAWGLLPLRVQLDAIQSTDIHP